MDSSKIIRSAIIDEVLNILEAGVLNPKIRVIAIEYLGFYVSNDDLDEAIQDVCSDLRGM